MKTVNHSLPPAARKPRVRKATRLMLASVAKRDLANPNWRAEEAAKAAGPGLLIAAQAYIAARDAREAFERENPNNSTKRWDDLLYAIEAAERNLRAAIAKATPSP